MAALRRAWEADYGAGSVVALAPSAAAGRVLEGEIHAPAETTAQWLAQQAGTDRRLQRLVEMQTRRDRRLAAGFSATDLDGQITTAAAEFDRWRLQAGQLLIVDEAGMTDTRTLDAYAQRGRIHASNSRDAALAAAYEAWRADYRAGVGTVLIAADNQTVTDLNRRAHDELAAAGHVGTQAVSLADGSAASVGDRIMARRVDRHLADGTVAAARTRSGALTGGYVTNGSRFTVESLTADGGMVVRADRGTPALLPADYVAKHVQLGYAVTAHRAQGSTVDTAHVVAAPGMTREALYVAMTRGRYANHAPVIPEPESSADTDRLQPSAPPTARGVLESILANRGAAVSAHQTRDDLRQQEQSIDGHEIPDTTGASKVPRGEPTPLRLPHRSTATQGATRSTRRPHTIEATR